MRHLYPHADKGNFSSHYGFAGVVRNKNRRLINIAAQKKNRRNMRFPAFFHKIVRRLVCMLADTYRYFKVSRVLFVTP
jgi:hypothetical protein